MTGRRVENFKYLLSPSRFNSFQLLLGYYIISKFDQILKIKESSTQTIFSHVQKYKMISLWPISTVSQHTTYRLDLSPWTIVNLSVLATSLNIQIMSSII